MSMLADILNRYLNGGAEYQRFEQRQEPGWGPDLPSMTSNPSAEFGVNGMAAVPKGLAAYLLAANAPGPMKLAAIPPALWAMDDARRSALGYQQMQGRHPTQLHQMEIERLLLDEMRNGGTPFGPSARR